MNTKTLPFYLGFFLAFVVTTTWAQTAEVVTEKVLPTVISEPPYQVGQLVTQQGHYISRGEDLPRINFRIVNNKMRVYWIDADGLIAEPDASGGSIRFTSNVNTRTFHGLVRLSGEAGLGSLGIVPPPHTFNLVLTLKNIDTSKDEFSIYPFRYIYTMNKSVDPEIPTPAPAEVKL
jgi:hypothetical protein